ncbi:uncharacterized protein RHOBADRAFT_66720, partial [Rhodotorula graminis WP1]
AAYPARLSPAGPFDQPDASSQRSSVDRVPRDDALGRQSRRQVRSRPARRRARGGRGLCQPARRRRAPDPDLLGHLRGQRRAGSAEESRHGARGLRRADRGRVPVALEGRTAKAVQRAGRVPQHPLPARLLLPLVHRRPAPPALVHVHLAERRQGESQAHDRRVLAGRVAPVSRPARVQGARRGEAGARAPRGGRSDGAAAGVGERDRLKLVEYLT